MNYVIVNENDVPVYLESISMMVKPKSKSRILTYEEYRTLLQANELVENVKLEPVLMEEQKQPSVKVTVQQKKKRSKK